MSASQTSPTQLVVELSRPYRWKIAIIASLSIVSGIVFLILPWLASQILSSMVEGEANSEKFVVILLVVALVSITGLNIAKERLGGETAAAIRANTRSRLQNHLLHLPKPFFDASRQGDLLALISNEVPYLSYFMSTTLASIPSAIMTGGGAMLILLWLDPALALLAPLLIPAFFILSKFAGRHLRILASEYRQAEGTILAQAEEQIGMLPAIKSFAREDDELISFEHSLEQARVLEVRENRISSTLSPLSSLFAALATVAIVIGAGLGAGQGKLDTAELFAFLLYAALLTRPVGQFASLYGQIQYMRGALARLSDVLSQAPEQGYRSGVKISRADGAISLRNVSFGYPGRALVLKAIDLRIEPGEIVALTGKNGAGKSTLISLLMRLYEPASGAITLDGRNYANINIASLRRQIGYVPQRALLFNDTVKANIGFGLPAASREQIVQAAKLAQAIGFIEDLPNGFDTVIGDHGVRLSGGERQRIALARALVSDPPILILDEATSMFDPEGEAAFIAECQDALRGRTVIIISHRPASLALAQRHYALEDGVLHVEEAPTSSAR